MTPADPYRQTLELIASGLSTRKALLQTGIARVTWHRAITEPTTRGRALWSQYVQAREARADVLVDDLEDCAEPIPGEDNASVQARRLKVDTLKWISAKLLPKVYGDYAGKGPDTINVSVETLHLTALRQLQAPIQDAEIIPE